MFTDDEADVAGFTAWLSTGAHTGKEVMEVTVFAGEETSSDPDEVLLSVDTDVPVRGDHEAGIRSAERVLAASGWLVCGDWEYGASDISVTVIPR